jgi:cytochrome c-type biogenesis protein CcmH/NrfG
LATCLGRRNDLAGAEQTLAEARRLEPDNPVVIANLGILRAARGDMTGAIETLKQALSLDPGLHQARFNLAVAYAKAGRRAEARAEAGALLARLPTNATERPDLERFIRELK